MTTLRFCLLVFLTAALVACGGDDDNTTCSPTCDMTACGGDDGCGGTCGCEADMSCTDGTCTAAACTPTCDMATCGGDDGCGATCGCDDSWSCTEGACTEDDCTPTCDMVACGSDDGCGLACGCDDGWTCDEGTCAEASDCESDDDCGGDATCEEGICTAASECETDDDCGDDATCEEGTCTATSECETDDDCGDDATCEEGSCVESAGCETDDDCLEVAGCCESATCDDDGVCVLTDIEGCCEASVDCDDDDDQTNDVCASACEADGCEHYPIIGCDDATTYAHANFDDGTLGNATIVDLAPSDSATVEVSMNAAVTPGYSVHFGAPGCPTYYSGPLTDCVPTDSFAAEDDALNLELLFSSIELAEDEDAHLTFWIDMAAEPALDLGDGTLYDVDYLVVWVEGTDANTEVWKSTDAFGVENSSNGFVHQAIDLSAWAGESINVHFNFITDGQGDWSATSTWHGAYLDDIVIETSCEDTLCSGEGLACPSDGDSCTEDTCTGFSNGDGGVCAYEWASPGSECDGCSVDADCGTDDECNTYSCNAGECSVDVDASCCTEGSSYPASGDGSLGAEGFEGDAFFTEWALDDEYIDNVSWQLSEARSYSGTTSLYMGDPDTMTYEASPANPAVATAWTPIFTVDDTPGATVLSFKLFMSTEYDPGTDATCEDQEWDVLSIWVMPVGGDAVAVWSSNAAICNSTHDAWKQIGIDLGEFAGDVVQVGFNFDSGDSAGSATANDYEGVYIDDVSVSSWCADECVTGSDCGESDACSSVWCDMGTCMSEEAYAGCCLADADCVGDNACATGTCSDNMCDYTYSSEMGCCSETWLGVEAEDFEDGWGGFTAMGDASSVEWHLTEIDSWSGTTSVTFSDPTTGTYANTSGGGATGELWSPEINVPPFSAGTPYMEFGLMLETEWDDNNPVDFTPDWPIDELCVGVISVTDAASYASCMWDSSTWHTSHLMNTTQGAWITARVDLDAFRGDTIHAVWEFEGDGIKDSYAGPFIDDVAFGSACDVIECLDASECVASDSCYSADCVDFACVEAPIDSPLCCWPGTDDELAMTFEGDASWTNEACTPGGGGAADAAAMWQVTNEAGTGGVTPTEGSQMLYFGNGLDYGGDGAVDGGALASCGATESGSFILNPAESWTVEMDLFMDIEPNPNCEGGGFAESDDFWISVVDISNGGTETLIFEKSEATCDHFGDWTSLSLDLDAWSGQTIALRFTFDSFDNFTNDGLGIAIDNLQFVKGCE